MKKQVLVINDVSEEDVGTKLFNKLASDDLVLASEIFRQGILAGIELVKKELTKNKNRKA